MNGQINSRMAPDIPWTALPRRYDLVMGIERLINYLDARLPLQLRAGEYFRLFATVFALVFASTIAIHLLMPQGTDLPSMLVHAAAIGLVYAVGIGLATMLLHLLRDVTRAVRVWHLWTASMAGFVLGYYFLPLDELFVQLFGFEANDHAQPIEFAQLLPVWFLTTYLFVQPYLTRSLRSELQRLRDINDLIEGQRSRTDPVEHERIHFESGRTDFVLSEETIRNVVVEDHYCYLYYRGNDGFEKRDLAMPLRDVLTLLPAYFVQVHRSHIVNPNHIVSIRRKQRNLRVILDGGYEVPVSRHRLDEVLPALQQQIASPGVTSIPI